MIQITDENLAKFLGPLLEKASKDIQKDLDGYFKGFEEGTLAKAVGLAVTATLEKSKPETPDASLFASGPVLTPVADLVKATPVTLTAATFDPTNPLHLLQRATEIRKAQAALTINFDDPAALEAAATQMQATPAANPITQNALQKAQQEVLRLQGILKGSNTVPATQEATVLGSNDLQIANLVKSMTSNINKRREHPMYAATVAQPQAA